MATKREMVNVMMMSQKILLSKATLKSIITNEFLSNISIKVSFHSGTYFHFETYLFI